MPRRILNLIPAALALVASYGAAQSSGKEIPKPAGAAKAADVRGRLRSLATQEKSLHSELLDIYRRGERLRAEVAALEAQKRDLALRSRQTDRFLVDLTADLGQKQREVVLSLQSLSTRAAPTATQAFFSSADLGEAIYQGALAAQWLRFEARLLESYREESGALLGRKAGLSEDQRALAALLVTLERKKAELSADQRDRLRLLTMVQDQKGYYAASLRAQESASKDLGRMLEGLGGTPAKGSRFLQMQGKLPLPVRGRLERSYGSYMDARLKAVVYHKGMDFRAPAGTPVRAVFDGRVVYADWFVGYGKIVIVEHDGEYFTLYAHLSALQKSVGDQVVVGEAIGKVGDTGSIKGPYLYFELRRKGISEDPRPWFSGTRRRSK